MIVLKNSCPSRAVFTLMVLALTPVLLLGQDSESTPTKKSENELVLSEDQLRGLEWRSIGPASMGGRITDIAVNPQRSSTFYAAAATGGLWKTENAGTTFKPIFDDGGVGSIGAVACAPSAPKIVWIGTGEANARNSASYGDGVYKSEDGGKNWQHMGLRDTRHVGSIVVHPTDPDTVFVAALGHVWGPNHMRGLYATQDGGETWSQVLAIDENTGCIDVIFHPTDHTVIYAAAYEVRRDGFDTNDPAVKYGAKAGIYRSTNGGLSFSKLVGGGDLPTVKYGRIGLETCPTEPDSLWAVVETEYTGRPAPLEAGESEVGGPAYFGVGSEDTDGDVGARVREVLRDTGAAKAGVKRDDVITQVGDAKVTGYDSLIEAIRSHKSGDTVEVTLKREDKEQKLKLTFGRRRAPRIPGTLGGQGANALDRQGKTGYQTGGVYLSKDRGETWKRINSLTPRPFYYSQIRVDPTNTKNIWVLGTQLHYSTNGGKRFRQNGAPGIHVDHHAMWIDPADPRHMLLGNDGGMHVTWDRGKTWEVLSVMALGQYYGIALDNRIPYRIYGGCQDNGTWGIPSRVRSTYGITNDHVFKIGGGDGFLCAVDPSDEDIVYYESQNGGVRRVNVRTGEGATMARPGQSALERRERAEKRRKGEEVTIPRFKFNWETPFIISKHNPRIFYWAGSHVLRSVNRGESSRAISKKITAGDRGSASALDESGIEEGVLWVGTDDGKLHVTRDGGANWMDITANLKALSVAKWVAHIEASNSTKGRAYVVLDGHRDHDFRPQVWCTDDYGQTFQNLSEGLPEVTTRVLREDPVNDNLLYVGLETGVWISWSRGAHWTRLKNNFPVVPVHDLRIHPRDRELVAGTHGRSLWIIPCAPLQQLEEKMLKDKVKILEPTPAHLWHSNRSGGRYGARNFRGKNPSRGAQLFYWSGSKLEENEKLSAEIRDVAGHILARPKLSRKQHKVGLNAFSWDLRSGKGRRKRSVKPGTYRVTVRCGDEKSSTLLKVLPDPLEKDASFEGSHP